jgi:uncharacterized LabA/DUF88 family protein
MQEEPLALFIDYENLAIGAREQLHGSQFRLDPVMDVLAERGRVVYRRAYGDWTLFAEDRRALTDHNVELLDIPQRSGTVRKNAADIKLAVDAIELCYERPYITTFVLGTGDSDFTPLVHKLRELNRSVIGFGIAAATSRLLPPACDEFFFYERLVESELPAAASSDPRTTTSSAGDLERLVARTLAGLAQSSSGPVFASTLKRAILRKDPTFSEADFGFRGFGELLANLADHGAVVLSEGSAHGDPEVAFPESTKDETEAFSLLEEVVAAEGPVRLTGLKDMISKRSSDFTEKKFGFGSFMQFCKAARSRGLVEMERDPESDDWVLRTP